MFPETHTLKRGIIFIATRTLSVAFLAYAPTLIAQTTAVTSASVGNRPGAELIARISDQKRPVPYAELESRIADPEALAGLPVEDREAAIAGELFILAETARNEARFDDAKEFSRRAVARLEKAERAAPADDLERKTALAEFRVRVAEVYAPTADFRARAHAAFEEKRAALKLRRAAHATSKPVTEATR